MQVQTGRRKIVVGGISVHHAAVNAAVRCTTFFPITPPRLRHPRSSLAVIVPVATAGFWPATTVADAVVGLVAQPATSRSACCAPFARCCCPCWCVMALVAAAILSAGRLLSVALLVASMQAPEAVAVAAASWWNAPPVRGLACAVEPSGSASHNWLLAVPSVSFSLSRNSDFTWLAMVSYRQKTQRGGGRVEGRNTMGTAIEQWVCPFGIAPNYVRASWARAFKTPIRFRKLPSTSGSGFYKRATT